MKLPQFTLATFLIFAACVQAWLVVLKILIDHRAEIRIIWENLYR